jgi:hypothetical protein
MDERKKHHPQVYFNLKVVDGLLAYAARLKGELKRADRELQGRKADCKAITERRQHYATLLAQVEAVGYSLAPDIHWTDIPPKVTALASRTLPGDLGAALIDCLKRQAEPLTVNAIHDIIVDQLGLTFASAKDKRRHRAVVVDALHMLRRGPPSVLECTESCVFGRFDQPEQRWRFRLATVAPQPSAPGTGAYLEAKALSHR